MPRGDLHKSYIAPGAIFSGVFSRDQSVTVDGRFEGAHLDVNEIFIGKTGRVKADIKAVSVIVEGIVMGNIEASNRIILMPTAKVLGSLTTRELIIQKGVVFEGNCVILNHSSTEETHAAIKRLYDQEG